MLELSPKTRPTRTTKKEKSSLYEILEKKQKIEMENYKCECGKILETPEEYLEHLKQKIQKQNEQIIAEEDGVLEYYKEIGI